MTIRRELGVAAMVAYPTDERLLELTAEEFFAGEDPIGRSVVYPWDPPVHFEVVGVVELDNDLQIVVQVQAIHLQIKPPLGWIARRA